MANISLNHIKLIIKSAIASATRYKPNLEVTDPDDPRYVAGKLPANKIASDIDDHINSLIDKKLGEIENGYY